MAGQNVADMLAATHRGLFPNAADEFFGAERLRPDPAVALEPAYSVVVVTAGTGTLDSGHGEPVAVRGRV